VASLTQDRCTGHIPVEVADSIEIWSWSRTRRDHGGNILLRGVSVKYVYIARVISYCQHILSGRARRHVCSTETTMNHRSRWQRQAEGQGRRQSQMGISFKVRVGCYLCSLRLVGLGSRLSKAVVVFILYLWVSICDSREFEGF
jgi:hypothetical protein